MTDDEKQAAILLGGCTFPVASYNKRFARDMHSIAQSAAPVITERQSATLWKLIYMHRRQIKDGRILKLAKPIYEAERKTQKQPSYDDLQALREWKEATGLE